MNDLINAYENYKKLKFPRSPDNDELYDLFTDLVLYDSFIAGSIDKILQGKLLPPGEVYFDLELEQKVRKFKMQSSNRKDNEDAETYLNYLKHLEGLVTEIARLL
jgi:hypothetical protein